MLGIFFFCLDRYAGNITKVLASAVAILVTTVVSYFVMDDVTLTPQFVVGGAVVLAAVFLYNLNWVRARWRALRASVRALLCCVIDCVFGFYGAFLPFQFFYGFAYSTV